MRGFLNFKLLAVPLQSHLSIYPALYSGYPPQFFNFAILSATFQIIAFHAIQYFLLINLSLLAYDIKYVKNVIIIIAFEFKLL